ncbi:MAG: homocysteine S-methyltransferase family protein [Anaerolineae bacterium]|nr:homocysteine S-methyltransferase family protein [Anaerolineae bacterium]
MSQLKAFMAQKPVLIADGAAGTMLQKVGLKPGRAPDGWNLENPEAVRALHKGYLDAGADILYTNTFGGTRYRLGRDGLGDKVKEINLAGARLARDIASDAHLVFGDIGPTGAMLEPLGAVTFEEAAAAFAEQAGALAAGGVDAIIIETLSDLNEARAAVEGVRFACNLPILATMSFDTKGRTMFGVKPEKAAQARWALGVDIIGANCGRTLSETLTAVLKMREAVPDAVLMAKPNAGLPHTEGEALVYDVTPEVMAEFALRFVAEAGVKIFGGCCGSTPAHIKALATALT